MGGGGKSEIYITESYPTMFPTFTVRRFLAEGQTPADFREVTAAERAKLEAAAEAWTRPPQFFIDLWNTACIIKVGGISQTYGKYNEVTGYFELNGITDITYAEAVLIYTTRNGRGYNADRFRGIRLGRTTFPIYINDQQQSISAIFHGASGIQKVVFFHQTGVGVNATSVAFHGTSITHIEGLLIAGNTSIDINFSQNTKITYADITLLKYTTAKSIDFRYLYLDASNWQLIIEKSAVHTAQLSIITDKDIYAKLTGDTTNAAAAALTEEELAKWMALIPLAAEKNISFVAA